MRPEVDRAIEELLRSPAPDRGEAIARLLASLDGEPDVDAAVAWDAEIGRRIEDLVSGRVKAVPLADGRRRILSNE